MKLTVILLTVSFLQVSASGLSQSVTLVGRDIPLQKVFDEITSQTGFTVFCNYDLLRTAKKVSLDLKNVSLETALDLCLRDQALVYTIVEKTIVVKAKQTQGLNSGNTLSTPPGDIHGHVTDSTGAPLEGASVTVKGVKKGVQTDRFGNFVLKNVDPNATIIISFTGFVQQQIKPNDKTLFDIVLHKSNSPLDAVQVIAYGTNTQRFNVGSVSTVTSPTIEEQPVTNPLEALEGRVPGLVVNQTSGVPGSAIQIQIRGQNSLAPNDLGKILFDYPLFIIDGVPYAPQNNSINQYSSLVNQAFTPSGISGQSASGYSPFNAINPADIESIEVLRDADATAIYGSRGANGVILITTKSGKAGKTNLALNAWNGIGEVQHPPTLFNTQQYLEMRHEALNNNGVTPSLSHGDFDLLAFDTTRYTNWMKYLIGSSSQTSDVNLNFSGGTQNSQFLIGSAYHNESFIYPGGFSDNRISTISNYHYTSLNKKLSIQFSANFSYEKNNETSSSNILTAFTLAPDYPALLNPNGTINWVYNGVNLTDNILAYLKKAYFIKNTNLISHFQFEYQPFADLIIRSSFGYNYGNINEYSDDPSVAQDPNYYIDRSASFGTSNQQLWIIEPQAEYKKRLGLGRFDLLIGSTFQQTLSTSESIQGSNYSNDLFLNSIDDAGSVTASDNYSLYKYNGFFGRANYVYSDKYILNINGRRDGSSRFGPGKQFGDFGSVGAGWLFSEERFIKQLIPTLSFGKLRASYGTTGSDGIADYQYFPGYTALSGWSYLGQTGTSAQNLANPELAWAVTKKFETGLEFGFFTDHLLAFFSWYRNRSGNQLVEYNLPSQTGFTNVIQNAPYSVQNEGVEIQITTTNIKNRNFSWNTSFNISVPKNILLSFPNIASSPYAGKYVVGKSLATRQEFKYIGVNDTTGIFEFMSNQGSPTYSPSYSSDLSVIGNLDPKFYGGIINSFNIHDFHLDIFFDFKKQLGANYLGQIYGYEDVGELNTNVPTVFLNRWQKTGDQTNIERFSDGGIATSAGQHFANSSAAYSNATYFRLKNISLSYNLPQKLLGKAKISNWRLYINAQNLLTFSKFKLSDPENQNYFALPPLRKIVGGIQLTL
jgi:TonB-linked SusC/RagA family outer membrane protein